MILLLWDCDVIVKYKTLLNFSLIILNQRIYLLNILFWNCGEKNVSHFIICYRCKFKYLSVYVRSILCLWGFDFPNDINKIWILGEKEIKVYGRRWENVLFTLCGIASSDTIVVSDCFSQLFIFCSLLLVSIFSWINFIIHMLHCFFDNAHIDQHRSLNRIKYFASNRLRFEMFVIPILFAAIRFCIYTKADR